MTNDDETVTTMEIGGREHQLRVRRKTWIPAQTVQANITPASKGEKMAMTSETYTEDQVSALLSRLREKLLAEAEQFMDKAEQRAGDAYRIETEDRALYAALNNEADVLAAKAEAFGGAADMISAAVGWPLARLIADLP